MARSDIVVVDASLAFKWVVPEDYSTEARRLLRQWRRRDIERIAPALFAPEIGSTILGAVRRGILAPNSPTGMLPQLVGLMRIVADDVQLTPRAVEIAQTLGLWKPYDSLYAALAEREDCDLWTGDERFYNAAKAQFAWVRWVGSPSG